MPRICLDCNTETQTQKYHDCPFVKVGSVPSSLISLLSHHVLITTSGLEPGVVVDPAPLLRVDGQDGGARQPFHGHLQDVECDLLAGRVRVGWRVQRLCETVGGYDDLMRGVLQYRTPTGHQSDYSREERSR